MRSSRLAGGCLFAALSLAPALASAQTPDLAAIQQQIDQFAVGLRKLKLAKFLARDPAHRLIQNRRGGAARGRQLRHLLPRMSGGRRSEVKEEASAAGRRRGT